MRKRELTTIDLFIASGAETKSIRDQIVMELKTLSSQHESSGFDFQVKWWEDESGAVPASGRSQEEYSKLIDDCDMVAVVIRNNFGKYSEEEFDYAHDLFKKTGKAPKIVVYTLASNDDHESRSNFVKRLKSDGLEYFPQKAENEHDLYKKMIGELLRIKNDYEAGIKASVENVTEAISALDGDEIHNHAHELSAVRPAAHTPEVIATSNNLHSGVNEYAQTEAEYMEALGISRELAVVNPAAHMPDVAMALNNLADLHSETNEYEQARVEYMEALGIYQELAAVNPAVYTPDIAMTLSNLAALHRNTCEYARAEAEYMEALKIYRVLAAVNSVAYTPDVAMTLNNLANLYRAANEYKRAETAYSKALELLTPFHEAYPHVHQGLYDKISRGLQHLRSHDNEGSPP